MNLQKVRKCDNDENVQEKCPVANKNCEKEGHEGRTTTTLHTTTIPVVLVQI